MAASSLATANYGPTPQSGAHTEYRGLNPRELVIERFSSFDQMESDGGIGVDGAHAMVEILDSVDKTVPGDYFSTCKPEFVYVAGLWQPNGSGNGKPLISHHKPVGIAVVEHPFPKTHYLDKIATAKEEQNKGVATRLLSEMEGDCPNLIWRADPNNEAACRLYRKIEAKSREHGRWIVFWKGFEHGTGLERAVEYAASKPKTLLPYSPLALPHTGALPSATHLYVK